MGNEKKRTLIPRFESGPTGVYTIGTYPAGKLTRSIAQVEFDGYCFSEPEKWCLSFRAYCNGEPCPSVQCRISEEILDECLDKDCAQHGDFKHIFRKHSDRIYDKAEKLLKHGGRLVVDTENQYNTRLLLVFRREDFKE